MVDSLELEKENQNQIIASISHDIKTPLTSVIGYSDRLRNKNLSDDKKEKYINKIYDKYIDIAYIKLSIFISLSIKLNNFFSLYAFKGNNVSIYFLKYIPDITVMIGSK